MSSDEMFELALILSGVDAESDKGKAVLSSFDILKSFAQSQDVLSLEEEKRGEKILSILYDNLLSQYVKTHSTVDMAFEDGSYDCVSSSILYVCLAKAAGLCVAAKNIPGHTYVCMHSGTKKIDIETTTPNGFNSRKEKLTEYNGVHEISDCFLLSLISKNLNSYYIEENDYMNAVSQAVMRLYFLQGFCSGIAGLSDERKFVEDARSDFDTTVSNYAEILKRNNLGIQSLDWLDRVALRWGKSEHLLRTYDDIACNAAVYYLNKRDFDSAAYVLENYGNSIPLAQAKTIFTSKLESDVKKSDFERALKCIAFAEQNPLADNSDIAEQILSMKEYLWSTKIGMLTDSGLYLEAARLADKAVESVSGSSVIKKLSDSSWQIYDADVHNEYVRVLNSGRKKDALEILQNGLKNHPDSKILAGDLQNITEQL